MAFRLRSVAGNSTGTVIPVDGVLLIGRQENAPGDLGGDSALSRRHARVLPTAQGQLVIEDLGSSNGTFVNGTRIESPFLLSPGDEIELGESRLVLEDGAGPGATVVSARPAVAQAPAPAAPPPRVTPPPPPSFETPARPGPPSRWPLVAALAAILLAAGVAAGLVFGLRGGTKAKSAAPTPARSAVPSDCGAKLGGGQPLAFVIYVESNLVGPNRNSVLAMPYHAGDLKPLPPSQCPTGGSGSAPGLTTLDADHQVIMNPERTLLFAVNQGSDSIAVFRIGNAGRLTPVDGSPFPSGGSAPVGLGLSGNTLVVAHSADDGVRDLKSVAPNYTTFRVGSDGRLARIPGPPITAEPGRSLTDSYIPEGSNVVLGTELGGPLRSLHLRSDGTLTEAPHSPLVPDPRIFGSGFDPAQEFGLGIGALPGKKIVYITMPFGPSLAVYSYNDAGSLKFLNSAIVRGGFLPCWIAVTPDGRWLYTSNPATSNLTVFDLSDPTTPKQVQTVPFRQPGNPFNIALDPTGRYLFVNSLNAFFPKAPSLQHVLVVGANGRLTELRTSPARLPVPLVAKPIGIAVLPLRQQPVQ